MNTRLKNASAFIIAIMLFGNGPIAVHSNAVVFPATLSSQVEMLADAPNFQLKTIDGRTLRLSDFKGHALVLNFWATWCVPCKEEMPWLIAFQKQYGPKGLVILGIAMDSSPKPVRSFTLKFAVNYPILMGGQSVADQYFVKGLPANIYIDSHGRITDQVPGFSTRSFMENEIKLAIENGTTKIP